MKRNGKLIGAAAFTLIAGCALIFGNAAANSYAMGFGSENEGEPSVRVVALSGAAAEPEFGVYPEELENGGTAEPGSGPDESMGYGEADNEENHDGNDETGTAEPERIILQQASPQPDQDGKLATILELDNGQSVIICPPDEEGLNSISVIKGAEEIFRLSRIYYGSTLIAVDGIPADDLDGYAYAVSVADLCSQFAAWAEDYGLSEDYINEVLRAVISNERGHITLDITDYPSRYSFFIMRGSNTWP